MRTSDVLLSLSLEEQRQDKLQLRLTKRGHLSNASSLRKALNRLIESGLVVMRKNEKRECFYRLAEGEAVEVALNEAWAKTEAEQSWNENPES